MRLGSTAVPHRLPTPPLRGGVQLNLVPRKIMTPSPSPLGRIPRLLLALVAVPLFAQTKPAEPANGDEAVKLAPFEVQSTSSVGYGAQYSSSSSRLNLRYIDVPQSIGVVTSEFLNDAFIFDSREFTKF